MVWFHWIVSSFRPRCGIVFVHLLIRQASEQIFFSQNDLIKMLLGAFLAIAAGFIILPILSILLTINAAISWKLINGIAERDASKVRFYKWAMIVSLFLFILASMFQIFNGDYMRENYQIETDSMVENYVTAIFTILWMVYLIYVIHSLEMMYREQALPVLHRQSVSYQVYPQHDLYPQAPIIVSQPYFTTVNQHAPPPYPTNPTSYPVKNNFNE